MNKLYIKKLVILTVPKKQLYLVLLLMGKMSALVMFGLLRSFHKRLPLSIKIVFKISNLLKNSFSFKDIVLNLYVLAKFIILRAEAAMVHILVTL